MRIFAILSLIALLGSRPPPPDGVSVQWLSPDTIVISWMQWSDANTVCLHKTTVRDDEVFLGCRPSSLGIYSFVLPGSSTDPGAVPQPGEWYDIAEWRVEGDHWEKYGLYGPYETPPRPAAFIYLPALTTTPE